MTITLKGASTNGNPHVFAIFIRGTFIAHGCQIGTADLRTVLNLEVGMYIDISHVSSVSQQLEYHFHVSTNITCSSPKD